MMNRRESPSHSESHPVRHRRTKRRRRSRHHMRRVIARCITGTVILLALLIVGKVVSTTNAIGDTILRWVERLTGRVTVELSEEGIQSLAQTLQAQNFYISYECNDEGTSRFDVQADISLYVPYTYTLRYGIDMRQATITSEGTTIYMDLPDACAYDRGTLFTGSYQKTGFWSPWYVLTEATRLETEKKLQQELYDRYSQEASNLVAAWDAAAETWKGQLQAWVDSLCQQVVRDTVEQLRVDQTSADPTVTSLVYRVEVRHAASPQTPLTPLGDT